MFGCHDDVASFVNCQLPVVRGIEAAADALHDAAVAVAVGEVLLGFRLGLAELTLVAPPFGLAVLALGPS